MFGVKGSPLRLQALYEFFDPVNGELIGDAGRQALIVLDLAIDFDALLTHKSRSAAFARWAIQWTPVLYDGELAVLFQKPN